MSDNLNKIYESVSEAYIPAEKVDVPAAAKQNQGITNISTLDSTIPDRYRPTQKSEPKSYFKLTPIAEVMKRTFETDWIVKGYLPAHSTIMIFGKPSSGKSLIAMEMAFCVGVGEDYYGHSVKQGTAIYVAGEGHTGISKRFKALTVAKSSSADNIHVSDIPMDLCSAESLTQVLEAIKNIPDIALIIIDTLHRNSTGDENSAKDFATVMHSCDELRIATGATIMLVHHSGHDAKRGRGSSSMTAAMDVEYKVSKSGSQVTMHNTKAKDIEPPVDMRFTLKSIVVGTSEEGENITASVLIQGKASKPSAILTKDDRMILEHLKQLIPSGEAASDDFYDICENPVSVEPGQFMVSRKDLSLACKDMIKVKDDSTNPNEAKRRQFIRILDRLHERAKIAKNNDDFYIIPQLADGEDD